MEKRPDSRGAVMVRSRLRPWHKENKKEGISMKKTVLLFVVCALIFSTFAITLTGCGKNSNAAAFEVSKGAYEKINTAYEMVNRFSSDIYTAWNIGINDKDELDGKYTSYYSTKYDDSDALQYFASELSIPKADLEAAVAYMLGKDAYNPGTSSEAGDWYLLQSLFYPDSFFSACVDLVATA